MTETKRTGAVDLAQVWAHAPDDQLAAIASGRGEIADSARAEQQRRASAERPLTTQAVKAALREEGVRTIGGGAPRSRQGVRLTQAGPRVRVVVDYDSEREAERVAGAIAVALRERGFMATCTGQEVTLYWPSGDTR